jgi:hypothetical protein
MTTREYLLDAGSNRRLVISWGEKMSARVLLDGSEILVFTNREEQEAGRQVTLADGAQLSVRFEGEQPEVLYNGSPLAAVETPAEEPLRRRRGGCLTLWLMVNLIGIVFFTSLYLLAAMLTFSSPKGSLALATVFLIYALVGCTGVAGIIGLMRWKKWGFFALVAYVAGNTLLDLLLQTVALETFIPLLALAVLYLLLRQQRLWEQLS